MFDVAVARLPKTMKMLKMWFNHSKQWCGGESVEKDILMVNKLFTLMANSRARDACLYVWMYGLLADFNFWCKLTSSHQTDFEKRVKNLRSTHHNIYIHKKNLRQAITQTEILISHFSHFCLTSVFVSLKELFHFSKLF